VRLGLLQSALAHQDRAALPYHCFNTPNMPLNARKPIDNASQRFFAMNVRMSGLSIPMSMTAVAMVRIVTEKFRLAWKETIDFLLIGWSDACVIKNIGDKFRS